MSDHRCQNACAWPFNRTCADRPAPRHTHGVIIIITITSAIVGSQRVRITLSQPDLEFGPATEMGDDAHRIGRQHTSCR
eukprot:COSAG01_NODE_2020_length_8634_cov_4.835735_6_plen_79_part_00